MAWPFLAVLGLECAFSLLETQKCSQPFWSGAVSKPSVPGAHHLFATSLWLPPVVLLLFLALFPPRVRAKSPKPCRSCSCTHTQVNLLKRLSVTLVATVIAYCHCLVACSCLLSWMSSLTVVLTVIAHRHCRCLLPLPLPLPLHIVITLATDVTSHRIAYAHCHC